MRLCMVALLLTKARGLNIAITGSSQGIGLAAAKKLCDAGHTVYHACRNEERAEIARQGAGGGVPMVCNLADLESVRLFAEDLRRSAPDLDVLCLNAAVAPSTRATQAKRTAQGFEEAIGVNHVGHFLLANLMKPHLEGCGGLSRLVVTASSVHDPEQPGGAVGGKGGATLGDLSGIIANGAPMPDGASEYDGGKVYKDSKLCNMLFCREAHRRWGGSVAVRSFSPGFIPASGLFREPRKDNFIGASAFTFFAGLAGFAVPIEVGGDRLMHLCTADDALIPPGSYLTGPTGSRGFSREDGFDDGKISAEASDDGKAARLWELSSELVGL
jgi:light-dependent protochlorophyllide reductase